MRDKRERECKLSRFYQDECPIRNMAEKDLAVQGTKKRASTRYAPNSKEIFILIFDLCCGIYFCAQIFECVRLCSHLI